jgi:putative peptidoglycan lipid II flippase
VTGVEPGLDAGAGSGDEPVGPGTTDVDAGGAAAAGSGQLVRSSAVVAVGTLLSRVSGLARVGALTYAVGAATLADAYNLANTTPNIVYELLLGGVLSATLVPIFVERFEHDDDEAVSAVLTVATVALAVLTAAAVAAAPLVFHLYTWNESGPRGDELADAGVPLLRFLLPQMLFYGWTALGTAVLNAKRRFAVPAFAPVLNNLVVCTALVWFGRRVSDPTPATVLDDTVSLWLLGLGTTLGIVAMTVPLWPAIRRAGVRLRWRFQPRHPAVRAVARRSGWTFGYVAANQVALAVVLALAAGSGKGAASFYSYAFIFFQLPHGLVAVSVMTTFVPELSLAWTRQDLARYRERFQLGLRLMWAAVIPAAAGMGALALPLVGVLLRRGSFDADAAEGTARVLVYLAVGLPWFSAYLYALRGFYAMGDTRTPFRLNLVENGVNIVLAVALVGPMGVDGLGLAYSAAYAVGAVLALRALHRRTGGGLVGGGLVGTTARLVVAAAAMVVAVAGVQRAVDADLAALALGVAVGLVVFVAVATALRVGEIRALARTVARRGAGA